MMSTPVLPAFFAHRPSLESASSLAGSSPKRGAQSAPQADRPSSHHHPGNFPDRWEQQKAHNPHFSQAPFRGAYPWSNLPLWIRHDDLFRFNAYRATGRPFFYLQQDSRHQVPLSGHLSAGRAPSADPSSLRGLPYAFFAAEGASVYVLNPVGEWTKAVTTCGTIKYDPGLRAVWSCLLRLPPHTSRWPSDGELTVLMVSIVCFLQGSCVPRDPMMAHNLAAAVPAKDRGRALALGRAYAQQHALTGLMARLSPEAQPDSLFDATCAQKPEPEGLLGLINPLRWASFVGATLMWALEMAFADDDHDSLVDDDLFEQEMFELEC